MNRIIDIKLNRCLTPYFLNFFTCWVKSVHINYFQWFKNLTHKEFLLNLTSCGIPWRWKGWYRREKQIVFNCFGVTLVQKFNGVWILNLGIWVDFNTLRKVLSITDLGNAWNIFFEHDDRDYKYNKVLKMNKKL